MINRSLSIAQVNTADLGGGAEKVALGLLHSYRERGITSWLAVGHRRSNDPNVLNIPHYQARGGWSRFWWRMHSRWSALDVSIKGGWRLKRLMRYLAEPQGFLDSYRGIENFHYPATWNLFDLMPHPPDIIHCHNLHGEYFDLRILPWLSQQVPVVITLHDAWLLTGHCSYSFACERWQTGCGYCPDLTIPPEIWRDATADNWKRKRDIFAQCRLYVAAPSHWLMDQVRESMLRPAIVEERVIPNSVNLSVFHTAKQQTAREVLGIPPEVKILLFAANGIRRTVWKDYEMMREAISQVAERLERGQKILFLALGEDLPPEQIGQAEVRYVPYQKDPQVMARYYQAADIYLHAAKAEVWGLTITEALACGTPVVATAVGGIPEQVKSLQIVDGVSADYHSNEATGVLVPPRKANLMATAIELLLGDEELRHQLGENAARDAIDRFGLDRQVDAYLKWYQEIIERRNGGSDVLPNFK